MVTAAAAAMSVAAIGVVVTILTSIVLSPSVFFSPLLDAGRLSVRWPCGSDDAFELAVNVLVRTCAEPKFGSEYGGPGDIYTSTGIL